MAKTPEDRLSQLLSRPGETMDTIINNVSYGVSLFELCKNWGVYYGQIQKWIYEDAIRQKQYESALEAQHEYTKSIVYAGLRKIATYDIRELFTDTGDLKKVKDWPAEISAAIEAVDSMEVFRRGVKKGDVKKIRMNDKVRAIELLGKTLGMFVEKTQNDGIDSIAYEMSKWRESVLQKVKQQNADETVGSEISSKTSE